MLVIIHGVVIVNRDGVIVNSCGEIVKSYAPMLTSASRAALVSATSWDSVIVDRYGVIVNVSQWSWCDNK